MTESEGFSKKEVRSSNLNNSPSLLENDSDERNQPRQDFFFLIMYLTESFSHYAVFPFSLPGARLYLKILHFTSVFGGQSTNTFAFRKHVLLYLSHVVYPAATTDHRRRIARGFRISINTYSIAYHCSYNYYTSQSTLRLYYVTIRTQQFGNPRIVSSIRFLHSPTLVHAVNFARAAARLSTLATR